MSKLVEKSEAELAEMIRSLDDQIANTLTLADALALAIETLEARSENVFYASRGEDRKRLARFQAAIETLKKHRAAIKPY